MKKLKFILIFGTFFLILLQACSSPMDVDTPRDKKLVPGENYKIEGKISDISFIENGVEKPFVNDNSMFMIDTSLGRNFLWMKVKLDDYLSGPDKLNRICIKELNLQLDSIDISKPYLFDGRTSGTNKCALQIARGLNTTNDTITYAGRGRNVTELNFNLDREKGELWMYLNTKVYESKIWLEYHDSTYIDYIIVTRMDTTYDNNGNMIIKKVKEKVPKEVTITIEEEKRQKDSLFLNGKFKINF